MTTEDKLRIINTWVERFYISDSNFTGDTWVHGELQWDTFIADLNECRTEEQLIDHAFVVAGNAVYNVISEMIEDGWTNRADYRR